MKRKEKAGSLHVDLFGEGCPLHQTNSGHRRNSAPKELRDWPKIFIESCRAFARQEGLEEVRLPKAETLYSYRNPHVNLQLTQNAQERTRERIKQSMELLYNANAEQLGFMSDGGWFKWQVPSRHAS
jgi:hypothetical protein